MLRGMSTVSYWADDWQAAKAWYTELLGIEPYFLRDGYAEWRLGDREDEFGLIDGQTRPFMSRRALQSRHDVVALSSVGSDPGFSVTSTVRAGRCCCHAATAR